MNLGLEGAAAVVTGGSKGIGRATALCLAEDRARVCIMARGQQALDETVARLESAGSPQAFGLSVDLGRADAIEAALRFVADEARLRNVSLHCRDLGGEFVLGHRMRLEQIVKRQFATEFAKGGLQ